MENRLYAEVATDLEKQIRAGIFAENEKLPSERTLASQYGVSRSVIREALRVLHEKGLVDVQNNKGGYVRQPAQEDLIHRFEDLMESSKVNMNELLDARLVIETAVAKQVIESITDENMYKLKELFLKMDFAMNDGKRYAELDAKFHLQLAASSMNQVLVLITTSLNQLSNRTMYLDRDDMEVRKHAQKEHGEMIKAIEEHDMKRFDEAIRSHLDCIRKNMKVEN